MGARRVINGVHVVPMGMANAFLIEGDDGLTLIDAGFPAKEAAVFGAIDGISRSADQLRHLVFTHGHPDHIGSAAARIPYQLSTLATRKISSRFMFGRMTPISNARTPASRKIRRWCAIARDKSLVAKSNIGDPPSEAGVSVRPPQAANFWPHL